MKTWISALALTVAGTMLATSAFAQSGGAGGATSTSPSSSTSPSGDMKSTPSASGTSSDMKSGAAAKSGKAGAGNTEQVKEVQQALKDKGHDPGQIDGVMGPKTKQALLEYQKAEGLKATGRLDSETASKLGVQAAKADTGATGSPAASPSGSSSSGTSTPSDSGASKPSGSSSGSSMPSGSSSGGASDSGSTGAKTK